MNLYKTYHGHIQQTLFILRCVRTPLEPSPCRFRPSIRAASELAGRAVTALLVWSCSVRLAVSAALELGLQAVAALAAGPAGYSHTVGAAAELVGVA